MLAPAEAAPKEPYKAGDIMREEDYDPARLPKGYSFGHGRITRVQKNDRPPDVLPEVWSSLTKAQKNAARKHHSELVAADAAPKKHPSSPGSSAGPALPLSAEESLPGKSHPPKLRDSLTPVMPCCSMWKHGRSKSFQRSCPRCSTRQGQRNSKRRGGKSRHGRGMGILARNEDLGGGQSS